MMTIQEEIREGIRWQLAQVTENSEEATGVALDYLNSQGVVIKVERELPDYLMEGQEACDKPTYQEMLRRAGYVAVEPLIKEKRNDCMLRV